MPAEIYVCVDVETAGPSPGEYALLSIGACVVGDIQRLFYIELQPDRDDILPEAMAVHGLSLDELRESGVPPAEAMLRFAEWVKALPVHGERVVFVALNAAFDWMFVNDYFFRYLGYNPFGHSALDIKAYYMGKTGVTWSETSLKHITTHLLEERRLVHNALNDAQDQAEIFNRIFHMPILAPDE